MKKEHGHGAGRVESSCACGIISGSGTAEDGRKAPTK